MRSSELRALEEQRAEDRAEHVATVARRRRARVVRAPGEGWDPVQLEKAVAGEFRCFGKVFGREGSG